MSGHTERTCFAKKRGDASKVPPKAQGATAFQTVAASTSGKPLRHEAFMTTATILEEFG